MMRLLAALWLGAMLGVLAGSARADTSVKLFESIAGNVNFAGTQKTMRDRPNGSGAKVKDACSVVSPGTPLTASLSGIPADAKILSAHLYWAGSGAKADYTITFQGVELTAPPGRQYASRTIGAGFYYFGAAVDVTTYVKGDGDYTFSGLTINNGKPWCDSQAVVGGFSLLVIYEHASQPFRVLNLYEGFQYMRYGGITLNLGNFSVPDPLPKESTGRLGHITWEGDPTLAHNGEELLFNREEMTDSLNDKGNQFNSKSNINGDPASHGIDFDAYTIASPTIQAGQKSASTRYQSGQDLVLLNAEIIAVPNVPAADLKMSVTRNGELQVGRTATYTLSASNLGPSTESGPVTVTVTLPDRLRYESVAGASWTCEVGGPTITCSAPGPLQKGASLPPLTLGVQVLTAGSATLQAAVAGKMFDNITGNNTVSNNGTAVVARVPDYAFTVGSCKPNIAIGTPGQCSAFGGAITAGKGVQVFVTVLSAAGLPSALDTNADTSASLRFSLSCDAPEASAGTPAVYGGIKLPKCAQGNAFPDATDPSWSAPAKLTFAANNPSARPGDGVFSYDDVGRILLNLVESGGKCSGNRKGNADSDCKDWDGGTDNDKTAIATLVSRPVSIEFLIKRKLDGVLNPAVKYGKARGFVRAGEEFILGVGAKTETGRFAPNFDLEVDIEQLVQGDPGTQTRLQGDFQPMAAGVRLGTNFVWDDVGVLDIVPSLVPNDYLDTGPVPLVGQKVGGFYPAWLETATESNFACLPAMGCPAGISGAAYSREPFKVNVSAFSLKDSPLPNYKGELARNITLAAFDAPGGVNANPGAGALSDNYLAVGAKTGAPALEPVYQLPVPFDAAVPRSAWGAPATIYLRASARETVASTDDAARVVTISSKRDPKPALEGGIRIVNGRLQLANAFGSELLRLPMPVNAQYWTGAAWANNSGDNKSHVEFFIDYTGCANKLALAHRAGSTNCNLDLLKATPASTLLKDGAGKLWLGAPGAGNVGSAWLKIKDIFPPWLPSTRARAVFGVHKSPLIYLREVY